MEAFLEKKMAKNGKWKRPKTVSVINSVIRNGQSKLLERLLEVNLPKRHLNEIK